MKGLGMLKTLVKRCSGIIIVAVCLVGAFSALGCASNNTSSQGNDSGTDSAQQSGEEISVYSREDGSGTRGAFIELFGLEEKDASGNKVDMTTDSAAITNSTSVMMTSVASDPDSIGYISLGSLNDTVKAIHIDGIEPTAENVKSGTYKVSRPFNIITADGLSDSAQDFIDFIMSSDGQKIVEGNGYIAAVSDASPYTQSETNGKVVVAGSSSVTPVMEKLAEAYRELNPNVTIEVQQSDSTTGVNMAIEGTCDIGMASRELKDSEAASGVTPTVIAKDGIAVIVAPTSSVNELTTEQVKSIFSGDVISWAEVSG